MWARWRSTRWRALLSYAFIFAPLAAVYLLPPDTSLEEVRHAGVLRACVPAFYPPLITNDPAAPGIDVELLRAIAANIGVPLDLAAEDAMGRDFNPRSWHLTRAQCEVLAGGVVASPVTKSFLETSPSYAQTGWATASNEGMQGAEEGLDPRDHHRLGEVVRAKDAIGASPTHKPAH